MRVVRCAAVCAIVCSLVAATAADVAAATSTTEPFKVLVISDMSGGTTGFTTPEVEATVKAGLRSFPAAQVEGCDTKSDPNLAKSCARKAVDEGYTAVIIGWGTATQETETMTGAGVPVLGQPDPTKDNAFATASSNSVFKGMGAGLAEMGCKRFGILQLDGTDTLGDQTSAGAESAGVKEVARAAVPINSPDLAPAVAKLVDAGATCITFTLPGTMVVQAMTAMSQTGEKLKGMAPGAVVTPEILNELGSLADNLYYVTSELSPDDPDRAAFKQMRNDLKKIDKDTEITTVGIHAYVAANLIEEAAKSVQGDVTRESLLSALGALETFDAGELMGPVSLEPLTNPTFKHLINPWALVYRTKGGKVQRVGDFINISDLLEQA